MREKEKIIPISERFSNTSFEYLVYLGKSEDESLVQVTIYCPLHLYNTIWFLRDKHKNLGYQSRVCRYLCRAGISLLESIPEISQIRRHRKEIFLKGPYESEIAAFMNGGEDYKLNKELGTIKIRGVKMYVDDWIAAKFSNIASDLEIALSKTGVLCLLAGMTTSEKWVPKIYKNLAKCEFERFKQWIREKVERQKGKRTEG